MNTFIIIGAEHDELSLEASGYRVETSGELTFFRIDGQRIKRNVFSVASGQWLSVSRSDVRVVV
jgi:hypothetical protein